MMRRIWLCLWIMVCVSLPAAAQDGLNLPTELYVLLNSGMVERYGLGVDGITTVTPENSFVLDIGVAPDGNWLAYRTEDGLFLRHIFTTEEVQIEGASAGVPPIRGRGETIAWTPDGDALAYTTDTGARVYFNTGAAPTFTDIPTFTLVNLIWSPDATYLAGEAEHNIWWIFHREGTEMTLVSAIPSSHGITWISPSAVVFAPEEGGLISMDMAEGNAQTVIREANRLYRLPYLLPDGTVAAFSRQPTDPETTSGELVNVNLNTFQLSEPGQTMVDLTGLRWSPGGELLLALRGGVLALVNQMTGDGLTLPITSVVAYTWGALPLDQVAGMRLPANAFFLAEDTNGIKQIWRLIKDGSPPVPLTSNPDGIDDYAISPNGRSVAYISGDSLWGLSLSGTSEPEVLVEIGEADSGGLAFSADGQRIAYIINNEGLTGSEGVWSVGVDGSDVTQLLAADETNPMFLKPQFAPNINGLLIRVVRQDGEFLGLVDLYSGELNQLDTYANGHWLRDGRLLAYGFGYVGGEETTTGLAVLDPTQPEEPPVPILTLQNIVAIRAAVGTTAGNFRVALSRNTTGPTRVQLLDIINQNPTEVGDAGFIVSPVLSSDGTVLVGTTHPGGKLVVYDIASGSTQVLQDPPHVWNFQWAAD